MKHEPEVIDASQEEAWRDRTRPVVPRIAFVSGGMGGIGSAICQRLAQSGHTVVAGCLPGYEQQAGLARRDARATASGCTPRRATWPTSIRARRCSTK